MGSSFTCSVCGGGVVVVPNASVVVVVAVVASVIVVAVVVAVVVVVVFEFFSTPLFKFSLFTFSTELVPNLSIAASLAC